ncbi:mitogen-activated protein kinase [Daldinia sp. FL1419]|nr:mitogen-activated protein kinase [Daldinia sp. FL1419]
MCFSTIYLILKTRKGAKLATNLQPVEPVIQRHDSIQLPNPLRYDRDTENRNHKNYDSSSKNEVLEPDYTATGASAGQGNDVEKAPTAEGRARGQDPNLVTWTGLDDPDNPKNWPARRKWIVTIMASAFTFITPVSSSMVAPALDAVSREFGMKTQVEASLTLSIFVLAYAIGPLFFGPLSESYGRVPVLLRTNIFYIAWNLGCGFATSEAQLLVFRFLAGLGGSAPLVIGGGVVSDCWAPEQRGKAVGIYSLAPLMGPIAGPVVGGFIAEYTTWRWVFWSTSAAGAVVQILGYFFLPETHHPTLLKHKRDRLKRTTGNKDLYTEHDNGKSVLSTIITSFGRPARMLLTQPIVQVIALYMAYLFGILYLLLASFPSVWTDIYHESIGIGGLNYISMGIGFLIGAQINAQVNDRLYIQFKKTHNNEGRPEFRIPPMFVGSVLIPAGLFWYGWSIQARTHWILPNIGVATFSLGSIICTQSMQAYIIDSYPHFAASGLAAAVVLRSLAGFGFPLLAPYMYEALDYGWGTSLLGFVSIAIGIPAPWIFWLYGGALRAVSKYAAG